MFKYLFLLLNIICVAIYSYHFYQVSNLEFFGLFSAFWYLIILCFNLIVYVALANNKFNKSEYFLYYFIVLIFVQLLFYRTVDILIFYMLLFSCGLGGLITLSIKKVRQINILPYGLIIILSMNYYLFIYLTY